MERSFRKKTRAAFGYAIADAVNTLLVHEEMQRRDRGIYRAFGFAEDAIPPMRPSLGRRVADFLVRATTRHAEGSSKLTGLGAVKQLMREGGIGLFERCPEASRFGAQTGGVHGGLLLTRTPCRFWHEAPGQLRDVDMASCYGKICSGINVHWGLPVVLEPGAGGPDFRAAVRLARKVAESDGWLIRVSGDLATGPNALIASTEGAITTANYKSRRRRATNLEVRAGRDSGSDRAAGSRLYATAIQSGVVTNATTLMIEAMPPKLRRQYEALKVDGIVLYPRRLAACSGAEYDRLVARFGRGGVPWSTTLDLRRMRLTSVEAIDESYVTLRFPLGEYARRIGEFRREAQRAEGKGGGADAAWKAHANTMFGVLGSPHLDTNNFVAANIVTAQARATAFALVQALNGFQVITDGCTYRRDQVPACTFAECLAICPDYPIRRAEAESGIPFLDPAEIPADDEGFSLWYRGHVRRFFGARGHEYDALFGTHDLAHKLTGQTTSVAFDALATDGSANYLKATTDGHGRWEVRDIAARSYGKQSKQALADWIVRTYAADEMTGPPPVTEDVVLLKHDEAMRLARAALKEGKSKVYVPLGLEHRRVGNYKALKASAFTFRTPEQRRAILAQIERFERKTGCALELVALRRSYGDRREGSIVDVARDVEEMIREGEHDLVKRLNLHRVTGQLAEVAEARLAEIGERRAAARRDLFDAIDVAASGASAPKTGRILRVGG